MQTKATTGLPVSCLKYNNLVTEETRPKITQRTTHAKWKFDVCPSKKWPIEFTIGQTMIQIQSIYFKWQITITITITTSGIVDLWMEDKAWEGCGDVPVE